MTFSAPASRPPALAAPALSSDDPVNAAPASTNLAFNPASNPAEPVPAEVVQVLQAARQARTPCGTGQVVWHVWGEATAHPALAPLVLFHGGSGSWTHWLRNLLALAASGRRVYVPDLPGFGDSALPPGGVDVDVIPEPLEAGLVQLMGTSACDLVGFSFGGMTAGLLAQRFPARVARLVLVGAPGFGIQPLVHIPLKGWRHLPQAAQRLAVHHHNLQALMLHDPAAITPLACQLQATNAQRDRLPGRRLARTDILARALPDLRCPVSLLHGAQDPFYERQVTLYEEALRRAPHFQRLQGIPAAGHWVQFEQPEAFNAALLALLNTGL